MGKLSRRDFVHTLGEADVAFVGRDLNAGVEEFVELAADGIDHCFLAMAGVGAADASGEIDVAVAVDIFEPRVFGLGHVDGRAVGKAAGHGLGAAGGERLGVRDRGLAVLMRIVLMFSFSGELPESGRGSSLRRVRDPSTAVDLRAFARRSILAQDDRV